jgi:glycosyltransferase involved in cell wall biosynthesis
MHVITGLTTGGAEMMLLKLLSAGPKEWDPIVVSLMDEGTVGPRISELGIPVYSLGLRGVAPNPIRALSIIPLVRRLHPHLIQGWMYHGNLMASLAAVSSRSRVPVLWNIRQTLYEIGAERRLTAATIRLGALLSRQPTAIIYNSQRGARQHEVFGYRTENQIIIPNGFDCALFRPDNSSRRQVRIELGIEADTILVGLMARYHPMKDHAGFLRSAALVAQVHPEVHFLLTGSGVTTDEPALRDLIAEHQLQDRTHLLGERSDIARLTAALDIACSASAWGEGFSNAIGEAMACEVPCVVTDIGESVRIIADTGLSVPPRSPKAMAQAIVGLIDAGAGHRRDLGAAARLRIESDFSLPAIVRRYEDLYLEHVAPEVLSNH